MSRVSIMTAGRLWGARYAIWVAANDGPHRFVSVDLQATPTP